MNREQLQLFQQNRLVLVREFLPQDIMNRVRAHTDEIMSWPESDDRWDIRFETGADGQRRMSRIENFLPYHKELADILNSSMVRESVQELFQEDVHLFKDKLNVKPALGKAFGYHQDRPAYGRFVSSNITVMFTVDEATQENGCLEFAQGYTSSELLPHDVHGVIPEEVSSRIDWRRYPTQPGDVIFFDGLVPHGSQPNRTRQSRRAYFITFNPAREGDQNKNYYDYKRANPNAPELNLATPFDKNPQRSDS